ncbi:MAG: phosphatidylglycerophosphatase A [Oligoflexia bacterium]|nr:phosphatidylglycerophosphatase A [Oligoflexia bacterium]MBF0365497.1 phosphatidylglycerophosphatase A [Oligoflexia bacterium]
MKKNNFLASTVVTFFGIGRVPFAPGTVASFITSLLVVVAIKNNISPMILAALSLLLAALAIPLANRYPGIDSDPKEIVIDEVAGQMLTYALALLFCNNVHNGHTTLALMLPFLLFRFFDIVKPWPIGMIDQRVKGGLGVMLDDLVAAVVAALFYFVLDILLVIII